jgi:glycerophosphoryl diester phosphodiesterase
MKINHSNIDIQGHRGCRGLYPENSLIGFMHAMAMGVHTLELDTVISQDHAVVISHEPYLNHEICSFHQQQEITIENEQNFNLYQMCYAEIASIDCGSKPHPRFPLQKKTPTSKPLLSTLFEMVLAYESVYQQHKFKFNIEIKSKPEEDDIFHPNYIKYSDLVLEQIEKYNLSNRCTIQSFDLRPLKYIQSIKPKMSLSLLIENSEPIEKNIDSLGFKPTIYSPSYELVNTPMIDYCKKNNIMLIPWTVNDIPSIEKMIALGVDGIISDYPNLFFEHPIS